MKSKQAFEALEYVLLDCLRGKVEVWDSDESKRLLITELYEEDGILKIFTQNK